MKEICENCKYYESRNIQQMELMQGLVTYRIKGLCHRMPKVIKKGYNDSCGEYKVLEKE